jgi:hypothetical protein
MRCRQSAGGSKERNAEARAGREPDDVVEQKEN